MRSLFESWRNQFDPVLLELLLALFAVICGAILGSERQKREKPAGVRTLILVCLGAGTFTQVSIHLPGPGADSSRVAAQIVTGIGFLGAGAILRGRSGVTGMTTAATIWMTAAIGMVVGSGHPVAGFGLSLAVRATLGAATYWEHHQLGGKQACAVRLRARADGGKTRILIEQIAAEFHLHPACLRWSDPADAPAFIEARMELRLPRQHRREFLAEVAMLEAVVEIHEDDICRLI